MIFCYATIKDMEDFETLDDLTFGDRIVDCFAYTTKEDISFKSFLKFSPNKGLIFKKINTKNTLYDCLFFLLMALTVNPYILTTGTIVEKINIHYAMSVSYFLFDIFLFISCIVLLLIIIRAFWSTSKSSFYTLFAVLTIFYTTNIVIIQYLNLKNYFLDFVFLSSDQLIESSLRDRLKRLIGIKSTYFENNYNHIQNISNLSLLNSNDHLKKSGIKQFSPELLKNVTYNLEKLKTKEDNNYETYLIWLENNISKNLGLKQQINFNLRKYIKEQKIIIGQNESIFQFLFTIDMFCSLNEKLNYLLEFYYQQINPDIGIKLLIIGNSIVGENIIPEIQDGEKVAGIKSQLESVLDKILLISKENESIKFFNLISKNNIMWNKKLIAISFIISLMFFLILIFFGNFILNIYKKYTVYFAILFILIFLFSLRFIPNLIKIFENYSAIYQKQKM